MKVAAILLVGAVLISPPLAQAQTATGPSAVKPARSTVVKVPRGASATPARNAEDTDRAIDEELKRVDHIMSICTGC